MVKKNTDRKSKAVIKIYKEPSDWFKMNKNVIKVWALSSCFFDWILRKVMATDKMKEALLCEIEWMNLGLEMTLTSHLRQWRSWTWVEEIGRKRRKQTAFLELQFVWSNHKEGQKCGEDLVIIKARNKKADQ